MKLRRPFRRTHGIATPASEPLGHVNHRNDFVSGTTLLIGNPSVAFHKRSSHSATTREKCPKLAREILFHIGISAKIASAGAMPPLRRPNSNWLEPLNGLEYVGGAHGEAEGTAAKKPQAPIGRPDQAGRERSVDLGEVEALDSA